MKLSDYRLLFYVLYILTKLHLIFHHFSQQDAVDNSAIALKSCPAIQWLWLWCNDDDDNNDDDDDDDDDVDHDDNDDDDDEDDDEDADGGDDDYI